MENILTLNQSVFGTKSKERRMSRRSRRALVQGLYTPADADEITYDEGYDIDGGMSTSALACLIDGGLVLVCGAINGAIKAAGCFGKGALKHTLLRKTPKWLRILFECSLAIDFIQKVGGNVQTILGIVDDESKLGSIIDKVITACSIGGIIATICDVCDGQWDGKCF